MFGTFKRKNVQSAGPEKNSVSDVASWAKPSGRRSLTAGPSLPAEPLPVPEVVEGSEDSDWALWQQSVAFHENDPEAYETTLPAALMPEFDAEDEKTSPSGSTPNKSA